MKFISAGKRKKSTLRKCKKEKAKRDGNETQFIRANLFMNLRGFHMKMGKAKRITFLYLIYFKVIKYFILNEMPIDKIMDEVLTESTNARKDRRYLMDIQCRKQSCLKIFCLDFDLGAL